MAIEPVFSRVLDSLGGLLYLALGAYVVYVAPREPKNRAFGLFAAGFGSYFLLSNLTPMFDFPLGSALPWVMSPLLVTAGVGALWLAHALVHRMTTETRRPLVCAALAAGVVLAGHVVLLVLYSDEIVAFRAVDFPAWESLAVHVQWIAFSAGVIAPMFGILYGLAMAYGPDVDAGLRVEARLVTIAFATYLGFIVGASRASDIGVSSGLDWSVGSFVLGAAGMVGLAVLWLQRIERVPEDAVSARNIALFVLAMPVLGLVVQGLEDSVGAYGITRTIGVLVLTYGILKHDILDIDQRVRWGVSKTTVTGVFVAVFFIVSEGAQTVFEGFAGNEFLGILAAGTLLFALAPIQRMADRVAVRAVPHQTPPSRSGAASGERRVALYRSTVERFLSDGVVSEDEEQELADLAEELGIGAGEAMRVRRDVREQLEMEAE